MSMTLSYLDDLSRVRIEVTDMTGSACLIERSTDRIRWQTVRGGEAVPLNTGACTLDDYEFTAGMPNYYRATPTTSSVLLPFSGAIVTNGAGASSDLTATVGNFTLASRMLRLELTISDTTKIGDLSLFVANNPSIANNFRWRFDAGTPANGIGKSGERFFIDLKWAELNSAAGTMSISSTGLPSQTSGFTDVLLRASDDGTGPITVTLHSIRTVPLSVNRGHISITFDDGHASVPALAKPKMDALGFTGTNYVIVESLGGTDRQTIADLDDMEADGWEIAGHAFTSAMHSGGLVTKTAAAVSADLADMHAWLRDNYPRPHDQYSFAYPEGKYGNTTDGVACEKLVRDAGFTSGRTILSSVGVSSHVQIAGMPEVMPYRVHAMSSISELLGGQANPDNLVATGGMLDKTAVNDGWMILVFHRIVEGTPTVTSECSKADFDMIMDAIAARNLRIRNVADMINIQQGTITPAMAQPWIKSITRPFLNRPIRLSDFGEVTRRARQGVFDVAGRSYPVAVTDLRSSRQQVITALTFDDAERRELDLVMASGEPIFLHTPPGCAVDTMYAVAGDVSYDTIQSQRSKQRRFTLPLTEVAAPHPSIVGTTVTWQSVINSFATWADVIAAEDTWSTLMDRIGDPEDVIVP